MQFGQNINLNGTFNEFENGYFCLKNMAAKGREIFLNMAINGYCKISLTL